MFVHTVFFWLKDTAPGETAGQMIADCGELLTRIETVRHAWMGRPAGTPREVADNSFDVGLTVVLDDAAGHDIYQEHALHKEFIRRHGAHWARVQVYDFR